LHADGAIYFVLPQTRRLISICRPAVFQRNFVMNPTLTAVFLVYLAMEQQLIFAL